MPVMTKREKAARAIFDEEKPYPVEEALEIVKKLPAAKFDESVDMSLRLGVDPKHADQMVRGAIVLPHGIGKTVRVAVFAKGEKEREAREAGADVVGAEDLVERSVRVFLKSVAPSLGEHGIESRADGWSSIRPSRPRTSWARSASSARCWAPAASCPIRSSAP